MAEGITRDCSLCGPAFRPGRGQQRARDKAVSSLCPHMPSPAQGTGRSLSLRPKSTASTRCSGFPLPLLRPDAQPPWHFARLAFLFSFAHQLLFLEKLSRPAPFLKENQPSPISNATSSHAKDLSQGPTTGQAPLSHLTPWLFSHSRILQKEGNREYPFLGHYPPPLSTNP